MLHSSKKKKIVFTSPNKSLLLFIALGELFRDLAKMNFKSSQNCRPVKLAALGERGLESCGRFTIIVIDPKQENLEMLNYFIQFWIS